MLGLMRKSKEASVARGIDQGYGAGERAEAGHGGPCGPQ